MLFIFLPIEKGYYNFKDLKDIYLEDVADIHEIMSYNSEVDKDIQKYYESKAKAETN